MPWYITFLIIIACFLFVIALYAFLTRKYKSPYTFQIIFGKKGVGKSCTMQKDLIKHHKRGWHCFADSNTDLPFVEKIDARMIYTYDFPEKSFITIDEINLLWDNRDFKSFPKPVQEFFRQQRKFKCKIIAYSQTFDCDKKLRDLADRLAIQRKFMRIFSFRRYYVKQPVVISAENTREQAKIADDYIPVPLIFGGIGFTYLPKYVRYYDTNELKQVSTA